MLQFIVLVFSIYETVALDKWQPPIIRTSNPYPNIYEHSPKAWYIGTLEVFSQNEETVTVRPYDNCTDGRVYLVPETIGINSSYLLRTKQIPDREKEWTWYLTFQAKDNHSSTIWTLKLHIIDLNDNVPVFEKDKYQTVIGVHTAVGTEILRVRATDADFGMNSAITYSLVQTSGSSNTSNPLAINPWNGIVTLEKTLSPDIMSYHYDIIGKDNGQPQHTASSTLIINVSN